MEERKERTVRKLTAKQAAFLQHMPKGATIEHRRAGSVGATMGEGPSRAHAGRGARVSK